MFYPIGLKSFRVWQDLTGWRAQADVVIMYKYNKTFITKKTYIFAIIRLEEARKT